MRPRIIIVAAIILVLALAGVGLYFVFSGSRVVGPVPQTGSLPNSINSPAAGTAANGGSGANLPLGKNFGVIATEPILSYFVNASNTVVAVEPSGTIVSITSGQLTVISSLALQNIITASFSYDGTKALVSFGDSSNPQTSVFDLAAKTWTAMPAGWQSPAWSPSDRRIAYLVNNSNGTQTLATINALQPKAGPSVLTTLHAQDLSLAWPTQNKIILSVKPSVSVAGSAWSFNLQQRSLAPLITEAPGLMIQWGQTNGLSFSTAPSGLGGYIQLINFSGSVVQRIKFLTLPSKCSFAMQAGSSTTYLYCAVPRDQDSLAFNHLPDDYNQKILFTTDDLYRVNVTNGTIDTVFADPSENLDVSNIRVFNNTLFFINRYDQKLYAIPLATQSA